MGSYGSVGAHIKTGERYMAQDHFKTPPGPKRGYIRPKKSQKSLKVRAKPAKLVCLCLKSCLVQMQNLLGCKRYIHPAKLG